jgi:FAD/FMN-containing dehydrogenase
MMGDETIDRFLQIKEAYDPNYLFQSNLFRRLF